MGGHRSVLSTGEVGWGGLRQAGTGAALGSSWHWGGAGVGGCAWSSWQQRWEGELLGGLQQNLQWL